MIARVIRDKFAQLFDAKYPGMGHDTVTFNDELQIYACGFTDGFLYKGPGEKNGTYEP